MIGWQAPPEGWICINTDGTGGVDHGVAAWAAVLRNHEGVWLGGVGERGKDEGILRSELRGVLVGLTEAWRRGWRKVDVQTDCREVISTIQGPNQRHGLHGELVRRIKELLQQDWQVQISHVFREGNMVADALAKLTLANTARKLWFSTPPLEVTSMVENDREGKVIWRSFMG